MPIDLGRHAEDRPGLAIVQPRLEQVATGVLAQAMEREGCALLDRLAREQILQHFAHRFLVHQLAQALLNGGGRLERRAGALIQ